MEIERDLWIAGLISKVALALGAIGTVGTGGVGGGNNSCNKFYYSILLYRID